MFLSDGPDAFPGGRSDYTAQETGDEELEIFCARNHGMKVWIGKGMCQVWWRWWNVGGVVWRLEIMLMVGGRKCLYVWMRYKCKATIVSKRASSSELWKGLNEIALGTHRNGIRMKGDVWHIKHPAYCTSHIFRRNDSNSFSRKEITTKLSWLWKEQLTISHNTDNLENTHISTYLLD